MSKQEFLEGLRRSLAGGLDAQEVNDHIRYYTEYIETQIRMGRTEEEIMRSLGEPRLIAKTLLGMESVETVSESYVEEDSVAGSKERYFNIKGKTIRMPGWLITILICFFCFFVLSLLVAFVFRLIPLLFVLMIGIFIYRMFRNLF